MSNAPLGYFLNEPTFLKLFERLTITRKTRVSVSLTSEDKFQQLLEAALKVLLNDWIIIYSET